MQIEARLKPMIEAHARNRKVENLDFDLMSSYSMA
jgi:hypothetical protein